MTGDRLRLAWKTAALLTVLLASSCVGSSPRSSGGSPTSAPSQSASSRNPAELVEGQPYQPAVDPANFVDPRPNPYFPLQPGTTYVYEGATERVEVTVTARTKEIMGISTTVVTDQVFADGALTEDTIDWYATDNFGNVWYMGEQTAEYENGVVVSTAGTWEAGVDGAQPGIIMLADPRLGDTYHQEFYAGEAEDIATVHALDEEVTVPAGTFVHALVTEDSTPLEPSLLERKWYAQGVGVVYEETVAGGSGTLSLIAVRTATD